MSFRTRLLFAAGVAAALAFTTQPATAQKAAFLGVGCAQQHPTTPKACLTSAMAAGALQHHLATASGLGSEVAGTATTLGRRFSNVPKLSFSVRAGTVQAGLPGLAVDNQTPAGESTFTIPTVHLDVTAGIFGGFSAAPSVFGILSLDLLAGTSLSMLPADAGFDGSMQAYTVGARVGIFRESFTVPAVTVSISHRFMGEVVVGSVDAGDGYHVTLDPKVTSMRATVGKDIMSLGLMVGAGFDFLRGYGAVTIEDFTKETNKLIGSQTLLFGGVSRDFLLLQLSAEGGVSLGFDPMHGYDGAYDTAAPTFFGSVAARLTF